MLYFKFKNYEEFKQNFGLRNSTRVNNILLSYLKHEMRRGREIPSLNNLVEMYNHILKSISQEGDSDLNLLGYHFNSSLYKTDEREGLCRDGDCSKIRYIRKDNGRDFKMKAGKFLRTILMEHEQTKDICEQAIIYICETFAGTWNAYASSKNTDDYKLVVDDDFEFIYNSDNQAEGFNSCMNNKGYHEFYDDCVFAKAASIRDSDNIILARCVIFTKVYDCGSGKTYRLAERQYAKNEDDKLKQILVNKLIEAGEIDGYKKVGASCHNPHLFILTDGTTLQRNSLYIESCHHAPDYYVPYMDSFKYYNDDKRRFYNDESFDHTHTAECTNGDMDEVGEYDDYHECYCREVRYVYVWDIRAGVYRGMYCDVDRLGDFGYCSRYDEYYDNTYYSEYYNDSIPNNEAVECKFLRDWLFSESAKYCEEMDDYLPSDKYYEFYEQWREEHVEELSEAV